MSARALPSQNPSKSSIETKKRKRATNACLRCRLKKQRCDGISQPCANCAKASSECTFPDEVMGENFLRQHIAVLEARVKELSSALKMIEPSHSALKEKEDDILSEQNLVNGFGFLSLTSGAEPLYVGGSSGASWGRIFSSALRNQTGEAHYATSSLIPAKEYPQLLSPKSHEVKLSSLSESTCFSEDGSYRPQPRTRARLNSFVFPPLPGDERLCEELFSTVYTTIQTRHCFMNFVALKAWHNDRHKYCTVEQPPGADGARTAAFFLWLTYALGLRLWEMRGRTIPGLPSHEYYFQAALQYYDHVSSNTTTIQGLLFLAMYSFRSSNGLSTWHLVGLAMRTALELGLHRKPPKSQQLGPFNEEMKKRIWWSIYCLERTVAFQLGRPTAIQDDEIDNELPLDIDCHVTDDKLIIERRIAIENQLAQTGTTLEDNPYPLGWTTMSPSLHHIRLAKVLTKIKQRVYHIRFSVEGSLSRCANVDSLSLDLDKWRASIPCKSISNVITGSCFDIRFLGNNDKNIEHEKENGWSSAAIPFYTGEWFELQYENAVQSLFIPCALTDSYGSSYMRRAAQSAMKACALQRERLRENSMAPLSVYSLHKLFMSGVFTLFALEKDPSLSAMAEVECMKQLPGSEKYDVSPKKNSTPFDAMPDMVPRPIKYCQESLSIYANHYPQAKPYAQCFENMTKVWLKGFERKDNQQDISQIRYPSPVRSETAPDPQNIFIDQFKSSNPPTLYKDDLNPPDRVRPQVEWSDSLYFDSGLKYQQGPPEYDLLSLGTVRPNGELAQLLHAEEERYQAQKPWLLGRMKRESTNRFFDVVENLPNACSLQTPGNSPRKTKRGRESIASHSSLDVPLVGQFMDNAAPFSTYSPPSGNLSGHTLIQDVFNQNLGSEKQLKAYEVCANYGLESRLDLNTHPDKFSKAWVDGTELNKQEPYFSASDSFGDKSLSAQGDNFFGLANLVKINQTNPNKPCENLVGTSDGTGGCLAMDSYDSSRSNSGTSADWLGQALEFWQSTNTQGGLAPDMSSGVVNPVWPQNNVGSSTLGGMNDPWLPRQDVFTINPGSALDPYDHDQNNN